MKGYVLPEGIVNPEIVDNILAKSCKDMDVSKAWSGIFKEQIENGMIITDDNRNHLTMDAWFRKNTPNLFVSTFFYVIGTSLQQRSKQATKDSKPLEAMWMLVESKELYEKSNAWLKLPEVEKVLKVERKEATEKYGKDYHGNT